MLVILVPPIEAIFCKLLVEAGAESHKRDKAKHQVQGKMTCVRLKDQSKLKNKTIMC